MLVEDVCLAYRSIYSFVCVCARAVSNLYVYVFLNQLAIPGAPSPKKFFTLELAFLFLLQG